MKLQEGCPNSGSREYKVVKQMLSEDINALTKDCDREVGSVGHTNARNYLVGRLRSLGLEPYASSAYELPYSAGGLEFTNIVALIPGIDRDLPPLLLGAHYDTVESQAGADDNAAAVSILLGAAESLQCGDRARSVVIAFFDAEEPPHFLQTSMGSIRFYEDQMIGPIHTAVIMDLVGHDVPVPGLEDLLFILGAESDVSLEGIVRACEPESGLRTVPTLNRYVGDLSDHHIFRTNDRPYLFLTCGHWEHYHAATDTPDNLNLEKIGNIQKYLEALAERLCVSEPIGPSESDATLDNEISFLEKNIMPALRDFGLSQSLKTRQDIDRIVTILISQFGL